MRKFRFQFETVLNVRKGREQDALVALGGAQRAYQNELRAKHELQQQLARSLERRESLGRELTSGISFQLEQAYIDGTKARIVRADQAIVRASRAVEKSLRAYLQTRRQTRMIEQLREKAYAEFRREVAKKERKELDDLVVMRARLSQGPLSLDAQTEETA